MDMQENRRAKLQQMANATSISEIARRTNRPISQICDVLKGRRGFGEKLARKLEVELGLSPGQLDELGTTGGPQAMELKQFRIPLVSWESVASQNRLTLEFLMSEIDRTHAFGVRVIDNSMAPLFTPGDVLVFDEDAQPAPGKFVLAAVGEEAVIRRYKQTGLKDFELVPENNDYPTIKSSDADVKIIAVMVESRKYW